MKKRNVSVAYLKISNHGLIVLNSNQGNIRFFNTYEPASPVYKDLIPMLVERGFKCHLVASKGEYRPGRYLEQLDSEYSSVRVVRTKNFGLHAYKSTAQKALVGLLYFLSVLRVTLFSKNSDLDVYFTQPPLINIVGMLAKKLRGQSYCCIVMDLYPQEGFVIAGWNENNPLCKLLLNLSRRGYVNSSSNVAIGRCMRDRLVDFGIKSENISVIPNWIDESVVRPTPRESNAFLKDLELLDKFVVFYGGNLGNAQHYDDILGVAEILRENNNIHFLFVGSGSVESKIDDFIRSNDLKNITRVPLQHQSYSLEVLLGASDVHFISLKNELTGLGVPSKAYATLAAGKPIVYQGSEDGEIARLVQEENVGKVVEVGDIDGLTQAVISLYEHRDTETLVMSKNSRDLAENKYSKAKTTGEFLDFIVGSIGE